MRYKKELNGIIKLMNSIASNSSKIESDGIILPISKNPTRQEIKHWSDEAKSVGYEWLDNDVTDKNEILIEECIDVLEKIKEDEKILK